MLQVAPEIANRALDITPYSTAVFGFLVAILCFVSYTLWHELRKERDFNKDLSTQTITLLTRLEDKFPMIKQIPDIKMTVDDIRKKLEEHIRAKQ